jgi:hypothetical protein
MVCLDVFAITLGEKQFGMFRTATEKEEGKKSQHLGWGCHWSYIWMSDWPY